jgi:hypothetical protein
MMATDFHVLSPVGPIANALVLPILPAIVAAGLALGPLSVIPDLARVAALPVAGLLAYIEQLAYLLARLPAAAIPVVRFPTWAGLAYYAGLGAVIAAGHVNPRRRALALGTALVAPALIAGTALCMWAISPPQVSVLAVGNGQAILFRSAQGVILVDAGPSPARLSVAGQAGPGRHHRTGSGPHRGFRRPGPAGGNCAHPRRSAHRVGLAERGLRSSLARRQSHACASR